MDLTVLLKEIKKLTENKFIFSSQYDSIVDPYLEKIFINTISLKNKNMIKDKKISILSPIFDSKNTKNSNKLSAFSLVNKCFITSSLTLGIMSFAMRNGSPLYYNMPTNTPEIAFSIFSASCLTYFLLKKHMNKFHQVLSTTKKITSNTYMNRYYKHMVKEATEDFLTKIDVIEDPDLFKAKRYLSDYLRDKTWNFEKGECDNTNLFHKIENRIKDNIFISTEPLIYKKISKEEGRTLLFHDDIENLMRFDLENKKSLDMEYLK